LLLYSLYHTFCSTNTASTHLYTLSLHDALPIFYDVHGAVLELAPGEVVRGAVIGDQALAAGGNVGEAIAHLADGGDVMGAPHVADRKSTRLNSSHGSISYAVFCLKKKTEHEEAI